MIRYLIFTFHDLDPGGGWIDYRTSFVDGARRETMIKRAQELMHEHGDHWAHIADLKTSKIIWEGARE